MQAFVTGSTGLLGSNLVNALVSSGFRVKALARSREKALKLLKDPNVEIVVGDMNDIPAFQSHLEGCDVLFHTAAYFREYFTTGDSDDMLDKINVQGTIELLTAAERAGVKKAIHVSSSGVLGLNADGSPADESTPPDALVYENLYFKSKLDGDAAIADFLKTHRLPVVMVLPTVMIGPQDAAPTAVGQALVNILQGQMPFIPPGGFSFVDVRDVAQAMINALDRGCSGERYILNKGYLSMAEMVRYVGEAAPGSKIPKRVVPYPMLLTVARLGEFAARFTGQPPMIGVSAVNAMRDKREATSAKAIRELGATFRPFDESFRDAVDWFLRNGYVRS